jgi:hypothetical protein
MTERYSSVAQAEVEAARGKVVSLAGYRGLQRSCAGGGKERSGGKDDLDSNHPPRLTVATRRYDLAFSRAGFEPTTFSLGKRKRPFRAVTGSAK